MTELNRLLLFSIAFMLMGNYIFFISFIRLTISMPKAVVRVIIISVVTILIHEYILFNIPGMLPIISCAILPVITMITCVGIVYYRGWRFVFNVMIMHIVTVSIFVTAVCIGTITNNEKVQ